MKRKKQGFTLIEVMVGIFIMLIIFIGLFELIHFTFRVVAQSKARITATALANQKLELTRNLTYNQVGTLEGIPSGTIPETETQVRNGITFTVKTTVVYIDDAFDNTYPNDPLPTDYKRVRVKVDWGGSISGDVSLITDVAPKGVENTGGGGIISVVVFDSQGRPVPQADIHIQNSSSTAPIDAHYQTNDQGRLFLPGAPACGHCYHITAIKDGYTSDRTYSPGEVVNGATLAHPDNPDVTILENSLQDVSLTIDLVSSLYIQTILYAKQQSWQDDFFDTNKIVTMSQIVATTSPASMILDQQGGNYPDSGYLVSQTINPSGLVEWETLTVDANTPSDTTLKYHLLYFQDPAWVFIPDSDLTINGVKNSDGFTAASLDLKNLNIVKYPQIRLRADLTTADPSQTPVLDSWQITWLSFDTTDPIPNTSLTMLGTKTLGTDNTNQPVIKYSQDNLKTDSNGVLDVSGLEWDTYTLALKSSASYNLANASPVQPFNLDANTNLPVALKLAGHQNHTLLVTIKDATGQPIAGADAHLYRVNYDKERLSFASGQVFFSPLGQTNYTLDVAASGYQTWSGSINVNGQNVQVITLTPP